MINDEQKKVIDSKDRFLFLLACAGSGKTRVIVEKIKKHLVEGVLPEHILAITFTKKSAEEMKQRVNHIDVRIHTFHQLAHIELQKHADYPYQISEQTHLIFRETDLLSISLYKNSMFKHQKPLVYKRYKNHMEKHHLKDFDDLLIDYLSLPKKIHEQFRYVFVDEFQDTNRLQYEMLKKMIHKDICVLAVGDPDQSIYRFRGAEDKIIETYIKDFDATIHTLTYNYRSSPQIVHHANRLIARNNQKFKKKMIAMKDENGVVEKLTFKDMLEEAEYISNHIKALKMNKVKPHNIAIIYRNHHRSNDVRFVFRKHHILYTDEEKKEGHINLMSIHQSKGLEFDTVFIIGLEQNEIPSRHTKTNEALKEERRLLFVGITRAQRNIYVTHVVYGDLGIHQKASTFVKDCGF
jgi:DNA helicase II / ATP-dependent DNA helicase PcrA